MSNQKKHGCLWWLLVGWWWWPLIGWWWVVVKWQFSNYQRMAQNVPQRSAPTPPQTDPEKPATPAPTPTPSAAKNGPQTKVERHKVTGTSYHLDAIKAMGVYNYDYDKNKRELIEEGLIGERVWQTAFFPRVATLEPEPDNPQDPKAIKVVVDGVHVGYIKAGSCAHIHKAIREGRLESVKCEIKGGKYKIILDDIDEDGDSTYELDKDDVPIYVDLYITIK